jgi:hypothetical protein
MLHSLSASPGSSFSIHSRSSFSSRIYLQNFLYRAASSFVVKCRSLRNGNRVRSSSILIACVIAIFTVAALDDFPDPPALSPHTISVAPPLRSEPYKGIRAPYLTSDYSAGSPQSRIRWIRFRLGTRSTLPSDWILLTRYAADPSPPAIEG